MRRVLNTGINKMSLNCQWKQPDAFALSCGVLTDWLLHTGSLTERLKSHCRQFVVTVLQESAVTITPDEQKCLELQQPEAIRRDVILTGDGVPWVYASSLMSPALYHLQSKGLSTLGNQPLGAVIFNDPQFIRQPFELAIVPSNENIPSLQGDFPHELWARRSVFRFEQHHMMVTECFLPQSPAYIHYGV